MQTADNSRLEFLDAARAFALVLGIVFHASLSFLPIFMGWAVQDVSTSPLVTVFVLVSHAFRMELFFLLAGFFGGQALPRHGLGAFVRSRAVRILVPFAAGWFVLRPLIVSGWTMGAASLRGDYDFPASVRAGFRSLETLPAGIFTGTHLWFLYYLALITALALVLRGAIRLLGARGETATRAADASFARMAGSWWRLPALVAPTAVALWFMRQWGMDTPDRSLVPLVPATLIYGGFFCFGWMLGRQPALLAPLVRLSPALWLAATAGVVATLSLVAVQGNPAHPRYDLAHAGCVLGYALMMWTLVFLTLGIFRRLCGRPADASSGAQPVSRWRTATRYVADSSYWLYLAHLPLVVWLQVVFAEFPLPWWAKLAAITAITLAALLLSYDLLVRSTWIGRVLNGRRRERVLFPTAAARRSATA